MDSTYRRPTGPAAGAHGPIQRWPAPETIETARLVLEPLRVDHAEEVATALADESLHEYIGGHPATQQQLAERFGRQVSGRSPDGMQRWLNWVVSHRGSGAVLGTVQATVQVERGRTTAEVAWVVAAPHQGQGYAGEAAGGMVGWLRALGAEAIVAHVHPDHTASMAVARRLGLCPTDVTVDGETRWTT